MVDRIYLSPPDVGPLEQDAVARAMASGWIAPLGPEVDAFEAELAAYCGREHAVALSSGTAALHLALLIHGVKPGDVVVTSTMTFAATANAITYCGATPFFVDADESGNMNPDLLEEALTRLEAQGTPARVVLPVDLLGKVADHERIAPVASAHGATMISDAAESLGATRAGSPAASYGVAAAVSFNGNKVMTTSGGGALLTDDTDVAARARYLATQARQPVVHYEHTDIGYNYRLSNILAALGRAQLSRLDKMIERRHEIRETYRAFFADIEGVTLFGDDPTAGRVGPPAARVETKGSHAGTRDNAWLTSILVDADAAGFTTEDLRLALAEENIEARPLWKPMHLQPIFKGAPAVVDGTSERLFRTGLSLPSGSAMRDADLERVLTVAGRVASASERVETKVWTNA